MSYDKKSSREPRQGGHSDFARLSEGRRIVLHALLWSGVVFAAIAIFIVEATLWIVVLLGIASTMTLVAIALFRRWARRSQPAVDRIRNNAL